MSYEPTIWKKGDKVASTKLNKIENGIQGNDEEITSIKEDLTSVSYANETLSDGYISATDGVVRPSISDEYSHTGFIPVTYKATVSVEVTFNASHRRDVVIYGYGADKMPVSVLTNDKGGTYTTIKSSAVINNTSIKYVRISFASYEDVSSYDIDVINSISVVENGLTSAVNASEKDISTVGGIAHIYRQYIDITKWVNGYYYTWTDSSHVMLSKKSTTSVWDCMTVLGLKAGTYYYNAFCQPSLTFVQNVETGDFVSVIDLGVVAKTAGSITIDYDFNLWITINNQNYNSHMAMFADGPLPSTYAYGLYDGKVVKSIIPYTDVAITDNYRVGSDGVLVSAEGYYAIEFDVKEFENVTFFRSLLGYSNMFNIVLMSDDDVVSIISDSGIIGVSGKYTLTVPKGVNKIKASGSLNNKYPYNIFKECVVDDSVITGNGVANLNGQKTYIVGKGYFPTIQLACDFAETDDIIFVRCGTYEEQVSVWGKKLHIIGENKVNTIIIDHSGNYNTPPLEMNLGSLSNMTLIEDGSDPTGDGTDYYNMAYCLHIEHNTSANGSFRIDNCDFIDSVHAPLGCGLYQDYTVHFTNCRFRCEATGEGDSERGAFYFHSRNAENCTGQKLIAENCIISSAGDKWAVLAGVPRDANNTGNAKARFSGCTIWNDTRGTADNIVAFDQVGGADVLEIVHSCGNTVDVLNTW